MIHNRRLLRQGRSKMIKSNALKISGSIQIRNRLVINFIKMSKHQTMSMKAKMTMRSWKMIRKRMRTTIHQTQSRLTMKMKEIILIPSWHLKNLLLPKEMEVWENNNGNIQKCLKKEAHHQRIMGSEYLIRTNNEIWIADISNKVLVLDISSQGNWTCNHQKRYSTDKMLLPYLEFLDFKTNNQTFPL